MDSALRAIVLAAIIELWPNANGSLDSATVYQYVLDEGVDIPDGEMHAILRDLTSSGLIYSPMSMNRAASQTTGSLTITWVDSSVLP